jgi:hypothetical protein
LKPELRERSFSGENQLFNLAVSSAAMAVGRGQVWRWIDSSEAVIGGAGSIS